MRVILGILKEERRRQKTLKAHCETQIKSLPKGSLRIKKQGKKRYTYLVYRDGAHVKTTYIGHTGSNTVKTLQAQLLKRKQIQKTLRQVKIDLRELEKATRARRKK